MQYVLKSQFPDYDTSGPRFARPRELTISANRKEIYLTSSTSRNSSTPETPSMVEKCDSMSNEQRKRHDMGGCFLIGMEKDSYVPALATAWLARCRSLKTSRCHQRAKPFLRRHHKHRMRLMARFQSEMAGADCPGDPVPRINPSAPFNFLPVAFNSRRRPKRKMAPNRKMLLREMRIQDL